jgi:hypothetical protein
LLDNSLDAVRSARAPRLAARRVRMWNRSRRLASALVGTIGAATGGDGKTPSPRAAPPG